jgi:hypothetical protein
MRLINKRMICVTNSFATEEQFSELLLRSKVGLLRSLRGTPEISPFEFENHVFEQMCVIANEMPVFKNSIEKTAIHDFPDIIAKKYYGVEVKMTSKDQWTSIGNSVLESLRSDDVKRIYIMFGKFGGGLDIKFRLYQDCLPDVSVTHSPRYRIDMELATGESIFAKMENDYNELRTSGQIIKKIKDYYRSNLRDGEELWWIDPEKEEESASPVIRSFRNLSVSDRMSFVLESMLLFPELFGKSNSKFIRPGAYLLTKYSAICSNLRDIFTAGGKGKILVSGVRVSVPHIAYKLYENASAIRIKIRQIDHAKLVEYWNVDSLSSNIERQWLHLINSKLIKVYSQKTASEIFRAGIDG